MQSYETEHCSAGCVLTRTTPGQRLVVFSCVCCKATLLGTFGNGFAGQTRWISLAQSLVGLEGWMAALSYWPVTRQAGTKTTENMKPHGNGLNISLWSHISITNSILFTFQHNDLIGSVTPTDCALIGQHILQHPEWRSEVRRDPASDQVRKSAKETICKVEKTKEIIRETAVLHISGPLWAG